MKRNEMERLEQSNEAIRFTMKYDPWTERRSSPFQRTEKGRGANRDSSVFLFVFADPPGMQGTLLLLPVQVGR